MAQRKAHEVIAARRECLDNSSLVSKDTWLIFPTEFSSKPPKCEKCERPSNQEINYHGDKDTEYWTNIVDDLLSLRGKDDYNSV